MEPRNCREAVIEAVRRLERRHGRTTFRKEEIAQELEANWSRWKPSTISTHISSHMVPGASSQGWADLERLDYGVYRLASSAPEARESVEPVAGPAPAAADRAETGHEFESRARALLEKLWGVDLSPSGDRVRRRRQEEVQPRVA